MRVHPDGKIAVEAERQPGGLAGRRGGAELGEAIHTYLARSRARLMLVQLEDVAGESEQANLPGTTDGHPNWRRRLSLRLEDILAGPELLRLAGSVNAARRQARPETTRE